MTIHEAPAIHRGEAGGPADQLIAEVEAYTAHNYHPLPVVLARGEGAWVEDVAGKRYLDMLAGYSALNFGHCNPVLVAAAERQLGRLTLTSRAFHNDLLGVFGRELAALCGMDAILPDEHRRRGGRDRRQDGPQVGLPGQGRARGQGDDRRHGRQLPRPHDHDHQLLGRPARPARLRAVHAGVRHVPYGDAAALAEAIDENTVAVLLEPIQGEGGVIIPPDGFLVEVRRLCTERNVLMLADEIQSGLGRTGKTFACEHEGVVPDAYILGKALGGGILPVSAVVARADVMGVFHPGEHGSTFGGNPLACAVGIEVVRMLATGEPQARARELGQVLRELLDALPADRVSAVRSRGLWAGVDIVGRTGRDVCEGLMRRGVLAKDTHGSTIRLAPPIVVEQADLEWAIGQLREELGA